RLACGRAPAAAMVADAIFLPVRVVGMARAEHVLDLVVVLRTRVRIADQQRDRRARSPAFEDTGQNLDFIGFMALRGVLRRARGAACEVAPEFRGLNRQPRWAAIDHAADRRAVAF